MRAWPLILALVAATSGFPLASYAADVFPDFDISANCKTDLPDSAGTGEALKKCANDERQAKQKLARDWSRFAADDKEICIKETNIDGAPSYVVLQTCLEIAFRNRAHPRNGLNLGDQQHTNTE